MQVKSAFSSESDTEIAVAEAIRALGRDSQPHFLIVKCAQSHSREKVLHLLGSYFECPLHGATSSLGVMGQSHGDRRTLDGIGLFAIYDAAGDFGSATVSFESDLRTTGEIAAHKALRAAGRPGEIPDLIWLSSTRGDCEDVLEGVRSVFGKSVPLISGTAAHGTQDGFVFDRSGIASNGLTLSVLFSSGFVSNSILGSSLGACRKKELDLQPLPVDFRTAMQNRSERGETRHGAASLATGSAGPLRGVDVRQFKPRPRLKLPRAPLNYSRSRPAGALVVVIAEPTARMAQMQANLAREVRAKLGDIPFLAVFCGSWAPCFDGRRRTASQTTISCVTFAK